MSRVWSEEEVLSIINEVRQTIYIWDFKCILYKNKLKKLQFWEELTVKFNNDFSPDVPFSSAELSKKWNNLKSYYTTEQQKALKAKKSGASVEAVEIILSNWKYGSAMEFLASCSTPTESVNNFNKKDLDRLYNKTTSINIERCTDEDANVDYLDDSITQNSNPTTAIDLDDFTDSCSNSQNSFATSTPHSVRKKRKLVTNKKLENNHLEEVCESSKKLADAITKQITDNNPNDPNNAFAQYIGIVLKGLSKKKQDEARSKISELIFELQSED